MVRVLHVITRLVQGGAQESAVTMALGLDPRRYDSYLAAGPATGPEGDIVRRAVGRGLRLIRIRHLVRDVSLTHDARALARAEQTTLHGVLLTAFSAVLGRICEAAQFHGQQEKS